MISLKDVAGIYRTPLLDLVFEAARVHRMNFNPRHIQRSTLMSIKTGGCSENCGYCSQSQHHKTHVKPTKMSNVADVVKAARRAKENGSARFCIGAAWREVGNKHAFKNIIEMVRSIKSATPDLEVCATLGMISLEHAKQLKDAGLTAYNHNLDTSREYYGNVATTRTSTECASTISMT